MNDFLHKYGNVLIGIVLLYSFFNIQGFVDNKKSGIIRSDGLGYYSYLPAMFIYGDYTQSFVAKAYQDNYKDGFVPEYMQIVNDRPVDKYFFGEAVLIYPFFILAHILSLILDQPADGYSIFYQYFTGFAAIFYVFLGCIFLSRLLKHYGTPPGTIFLINVVMVFGTNLFHYAVVEPSMSHAFSYSMVAGFLFFTKESIVNKKSLYILGAFIMLALVTLIRPVNAIIILAIPFLTGSKKNLLNYFKYLLKEYKIVITSALFAAFIISLQCLLWYLQTGKWIVYAYTYERFNFNSPEIMNVLFSYRKGLFVWTPILFFSLTGLIHLIIKNKFSFISIVILLSVLIYVISCWYMWYYGMSFGFRPMIEFFPLFAILLALGFSTFNKRYSKFILVFLCLACLYVNQVQAYQYRNYILHWSVMSKEKYWKVFLKTGGEWKGMLWEYFLPGEIKGFTKAKYTIDFESDSNNQVSNGKTNLGSLAHSGNFASVLTAMDEFGVTFTLRDDSVLASLKKGVLECSLYVYDLMKHNTDSTFLVVSLHHPDGTTYYYKMSSLERSQREQGKWRTKGLSLRLPVLENQNDELRIYLWNPQKNNLVVDDIEISLLEEI